jgi:hypothetical protein
MMIRAAQVVAVSAQLGYSKDETNELLRPHGDSIEKEMHHIASATVTSFDMYVDKLLSDWATRMSEKKWPSATTQQDVPMFFWASFESFRPVSEGLERTRRAVGGYLNSEFAKSSLGPINAELWYIPIVMPKNMRERYPERSRFYRKKRAYAFSPQLDYEVFVDGSFEDQLKEYIRGIALSAPHLKGLGATPEQIEDFKRILEEAVPRILVEQLDQTWH